METTEQEKTSSPPNPEGKGGFKEHPENINYGGRPKTKILTGALLQFLEEIDPQTGNPRFVDLAKKLGLMAYKGDIHAMREVFDRIEGKATQTLKHEGELNVKKLETIIDELTETPEDKDTG